MLEILRKIVQDVAAAPNLDAALETTVASVQQAMGSAVCTVYLLESRPTRLVFRATRGLNQALVGKVALGIGEGLVGHVAERAEPVNVEQVVGHPKNRYIPGIGEEAYSSFLGVPIIHQGNTVGVLVVQQQESRRFDESEEALLITLSAQLAGVIAHAEAMGRITGPKVQRGSSLFRGTGGAPGIALGTAIVLYPEVDLAQVPYRQVRNTQREIERFERAVASAKEEIQEVASGLVGQIHRETLGIFEAYLQMLDPHAIPFQVIARIKEGQWAQGALKEVIALHSAQFEKMDDPYLRERGDDVRELGNRLLGHIERRNKRRQHFPRDTILIGDDLGVADIGKVPRDRLQGLVSGRGSVNSHLAILAEAMGIPTVMGVKDLPMAMIDGGHVIVDGLEGAVITSPNRSQRDTYARRKVEERMLTDELEHLATAECTTPDGHRTKLWVNTGLLGDATRSIDRGAEGVGLYRTEIHFMSSDTFPTEEEQRVIYRAHLEAFSPRPVTMRTLDIGGDKSLPYFPIEEDNPFLGWRGLRVSLDHPEIFIAQIRAMMRASEGLKARLRIMLPMVSSIAQVDAAKRLIDQCYGEVIEEGASIRMPEVGVMIEVPAAVYQAEAILERVDFLSVGSNDLVQYMLAVDRNNPQVAGLFQEFHPAVLQALSQIAKSTMHMNKDIAVCGEMAGHPEAAMLLMAMGYEMLSMNMTNLLPVKKALSTISLETAKKTLGRVLALDSAEEVKSTVDRLFRREGLGSLIRGPGGRQRERSKH